jgi:hypothetical protein
VPLSVWLSGWLSDVGASWVSSRAARTRSHAGGGNYRPTNAAIGKPPAAANPKVAAKAATEAAAEVAATSAEMAAAEALRRERACKLMAKNIPAEIPIAQVRQHFGKYGEVSNVTLSFAHTNYGFAVITYTTPEAVQRARAGKVA